MDSLEELAVRLLSHLGPDLRPLDVELLPGQVPGELPLELPLPPGARLLGSATYRRDGRPSQVVVVLDTGASPEETIDFYRREMPRRGWSPAPHGWAPGGGGGDRALHGGVLPEPGWPLALRLRSAAGGGPYRRPDRDRPAHTRAVPGAGENPPDTDERVPPLAVPPGVRLYPGSGGGSTHDWSSNALAETELSPAELEAHFARQLEGHGWERLAGHAEGPLAWSLWRLPGEEDWQGILTVAEWPGRRLRSLSIRIQSNAVVEGGWAYFG